MNEKNYIFIPKWFCELQKVIEDKIKELEEMEKVQGSSHENHQKCLAKLEELSNEKSSLELKNNSIENHSVKNTKQNWSKMRVLHPFLFVRQMHCITSSGGTMICHWLSTVNN